MTLSVDLSAVFPPSPGAFVYPEVLEGTFVSRPNRFVALVDGPEGRVVCHVKNTGRCRELLLPGARVVLARGRQPKRKTAYDLIAVYKGSMLVNLDSQAPNHVALPWLQARYPQAQVCREVAFGNSRLDFHVQGPEFSLYVEAKGCTLEQDGLALFPDAPTERGIKHLHSLMRCVQQGHQAMALFVIQMKPVTAFSPHDAMHPAFGQALRQAAQAGVQVVAYDCLVQPHWLSLDAPVPVLL